MDSIPRLQAYLKKHQLSQKDFGALVGVSPGMVWQWFNGHRPIGAERAVEIERRTKGEIRREDLRPDLYRRVA